jgi:hypothetical protein
MQCKGIERGYKMQPRKDVSPGKGQDRIHSMWSDLEQTIQKRMEVVLLCVYHNMQSVHKELTERTEETQVELQTVEVHLDRKTTIESDFNAVRLETQEAHGDQSCETRIPVSAGRS